MAVKWNLFDEALHGDGARDERVERQLLVNKSRELQWLTAVILVMIMLFCWAQEMRGGQRLLMQVLLVGFCLSPLVARVVGWYTGTAVAELARLAPWQRVANVLVVQLLLPGAMVWLALWPSPWPRLQWTAALWAAVAAYGLSVWAYDHYRRYQLESGEYLSAVPKRERWVLVILASLALLGTAAGLLLPLDRLPGAGPLLRLTEVQQAAEAFNNAPLAAFTYRDLEQEMTCLRRDDACLILLEDRAYYVTDDRWRVHEDSAWRELAEGERPPVLYPALTVSRQQLREGRYAVDQEARLRRYRAFWSRDGLLAQDLALYGLQEGAEAEAVYTLGDGALAGFALTMRGTAADGRPGTFYYAFEVTSTDPVTVLNLWQQAQDELAGAVVYWPQRQEQQSAAVI